MTRGEDLKKNFKDDTAIRACLLQQPNYDAVVDALSNNDDAAISAIFVQCGVPTNKQAKYLRFAKTCYQQHVHPW